MIAPLDSTGREEWTIPQRFRDVCHAEVAPRDHRWIEILARLRDWVTHPASIPRETGDQPVDGPTLQRGIDVASSLYSAGAAAPTQVIPTSEGGLSFWRASDSFGTTASDWSSTTLELLPDGRAELTIARSDNRCELFVFPEGVDPE